MGFFERRKKYRRPADDQGGFSLLEVLVSTLLFSMIIVSALGVFNASIASQRNAIGTQNIQEGLRYVFEMISKEIRSAQRSDGSCPANPPPATNNRYYATSSAADALYFKNKYGQCVSYSLAAGQLMVRRDNLIATSTSDEIKVNRLEFYIRDNNQTAGSLSLQPRVTISLDAEVADGADKQTIKMQTTISSRFYEEN